LTAEDAARSRRRLQRVGGGCGLDGDGRRHARRQFDAGRHPVDVDADRYALGVNRSPAVKGPPTRPLPLSVPLLATVTAPVISPFTLPPPFWRSPIC